MEKELDKFFNWIEINFHVEGSPFYLLKDGKLVDGEQYDFDELIEKYLKEYAKT